MGDFGVFPAPGQADFEQQRHLRRWAENFQNAAKMRMQMLKIPNFCDYLRDAASRPQTFLRTN